MAQHRWGRGGDTFHRCLIPQVSLLLGLEEPQGLLPDVTVEVFRVLDFLFFSRPSPSLSSPRMAQPHEP